MSKRAVRQLTERNGLGPVSVQYLGQVSARAGAFTHAAKHQLLEITAERLAERPEAESPGEVVDALGSPSEVVDTYRRDEFDGRYAGFVARWWSLPGRSRWRQALGACSLIGIAWFGIAYFTAVPKLSNPCGGAWVGDEPAGRREAAGASEYVLVASDEPIRILVCVGAPAGSDVIITDLHVGFGTFGPQVADLQRQSFDGRAPLEPFKPYEAAGYDQVILSIDAASCPAGGGVSQDSLEVEYRFRGRTRSAKVPLTSTITIWCDDAA